MAACSDMIEAEEHAAFTALQAVSHGPRCEGEGVLVQ